MTTSAQPASVAETSQCPTCGTELQGDFCHQCGEKRHDERHLALRHFALHALDELTHIDSKVFATFRYLFSRPGYLTKEYVAGRKSPYMKPLSLFLLSVALLFLMDSFIPRSAYDVDWVRKTDKSGNMDLLLTRLAAKKHLPKEVILERIQTRVHKISTGMQFANVLVLAGILALLYHKRYFVVHLVFAFHFVSFDYMVSVLLRPVTLLVGTQTLASIVWAAVVTLGLLSYMFLAQRRVYGQGTGLTLTKAFVSQLVTQAVLILTQVVTLLVGIVAAARS